MRDYKGILISKGRKPEGMNLGPEVNRIWDALDPIDAFLRDLSSGIGRISRGQNPDSSGDPIGGLTLDDYWFLPGRVGNTIARGGTLAGGSATLVSTAHPTKGAIYFGEAQNSAYDELNDRLGIGTVSPDALLEVENDFVVSQTNIAVDGSASESSTWRGQPGADSTNIWEYITNSDDTQYISQGLGNAGSITNNIGFGAPPASATRVSVRITCRHMSGTGTFTFNWDLSRGGTPVKASTGNTLTASFAVLTYELTAAERTTLFGAAGNLVMIYHGSGGGGNNAFEVSYAEVEFASGDTTDLTRWTGASGTVINRIDSEGQVGLGTSTNTLGFPVSFGDSTDRTKILGLNLSGITTATTRNWAIANVSGTPPIATAQPALASLLYGGGVTTAMVALPIGANGEILAVASGLPDWLAFSALSSAEFLDSAFRIIGSGDPTKKLALEVDGFTPATTRTLTPQNADYTIAGLETAQTFTNTNTFTPGSNIALTLNANTSGAYLRFVKGAQTGEIFIPTLDANGVWNLPNLYGTFAVINGGGTAQVWTGRQEFHDNRFHIVDDLDTGKTLQFSVGGFPAATTRTLTPQNADYTIAGLEVIQTFTAAQTFTATATFGGGDILLRSTGTSDFTGLVDTQDIRVSSSLRLRSTVGIETSIGNAAGGVSHTLAWPSSQGAVNTLLRNDGAGALSWNTVASLVDIARTWTTLQTFPDNTFKLVGSADASKTLVFELDGAAVGADLILSWAGTLDRTVTFPNATTMLAGLAVAQTFTRAQTIDGSADEVQATIRAFLGQSANILELYDESGTLGIMIDAGAFLGCNALGIGPVPAGPFAIIAGGGLTASRTLTAQDYSGAIQVVGNSDAPPAIGSLGRVNRTGQIANIASTNLTNTVGTGVFAVEAILMTTAAAVGAGTLALTIAWTDNVGATTSTVIAAHSLAVSGRTTGRHVLRRSSGEISYSVTITGIYSTSTYAVYVRLVSQGA